MHELMNNYNIIVKSLSSITDKQYFFRNYFHRNRKRVFIIFEIVQKESKQNYMCVMLCIYDVSRIIIIFIYLFIMLMYDTPIVNKPTMMLYTINDCNHFHTIFFLKFQNR